MTLLADLIGSKSRSEIFRLLFERAGTELYLRELHRQSGISLRPIQQELAKLSSAGLVRVRKDGNRLYYSANSEHPLFPEIQRLVEKTSGVVELLKAALSVPEVQVAFIFGSVASGTPRPNSDLDLFVIGDLGLRKASGLLSGMTDRIGRLVNPHVLTPDDFARKAQNKNHFVTSVLRSQKTFVIGDENVLKRLGKKRLAEGA